MHYPKVSIVVLNLNGVKDTIECLESLRKITYPNYKVIVVDNGSTGSDVKILREKFGNFIYIIENDRNYGFAEGNNIGIRYALENQNPEYVFLLNNDTIVDRTFLEEIVKVAESDESISSVSPTIYKYDEPDKLDWIPTKEVSLWTCKTKQQVDINTTNEKVECVTSGCWMIKTKVFDKIGLLDSRLFFGGDEQDWWIRNKRAGYKTCWAPQAKIWHKGRKSVEKKISKVDLYYTTRGLFLIEKKHANLLQLVFFISYFFVINFPVTCVRIVKDCKEDRNMLKKHLKSYFRGVIDGLRIKV
ncbi:MAG: glycosyltransferase family 2 protein [Candidatus Thermoplasmatota archaeon]|nr:glycosyltransferase family 2 protein [Candidatus Thermoplasmatota archaeon]